MVWGGEEGDGEFSQGEIAILSLLNLVKGDSFKVKMSKNSREQSLKTFYTFQQNLKRNALALS